MCGGVHVFRGARLEKGPSKAHPAGKQRQMLEGKRFFQTRFLDHNVANHSEGSFVSFKRCHVAPPDTRTHPLHRVESLLGPSSTSRRILTLSFGRPGGGLPLPAQDLRQLRELAQRTANLRTRILYFRGSDSERILILRGGIFSSIGDFLEILSQQILVGIIFVGRLGILGGKKSASKVGLPPLLARSS